MPSELVHLISIIAQTRIHLFLRNGRIWRELQLTMENRIENRSTTINTIRVAVHVVMANPFSVTNAQIQSQIDVLTNDFRAANGDIGNAHLSFKG